MQFECGWSISGVVSELRELKSAKNETWRGYVVKIATLGMTAEVNVTPEQYKTLAVGGEVRASGRFEDKGGYLRLIAAVIGEPTPARKAGAA